MQTTLAKLPQIPYLHSYPGASLLCASDPWRGGFTQQCGRLLLAWLRKNDGATCFPALSKKTTLRSHTAHSSYGSEKANFHNYEQQKDWEATSS